MAAQATYDGLGKNILLFKCEIGEEAVCKVYGLGLVYKTILQALKTAVTADLTNHMDPLGASWCKCQNFKIPFCTIAKKNKTQWKRRVKNKQTNPIDTHK